MIVKVNFLAKNVLAMTLWPFILVNSKYPLSESTLRHEKIHLKQQVEMLIIPFYIWYVIEWIFKGYENISFEREAHENESDLNYKRKPYAWLKYL